MNEERYGEFNHGAKVLKEMTASSLFWDNPPKYKITVKEYQLYFILGTNEQVRPKRRLLCESFEARKLKHLNSENLKKPVITFDLLVFLLRFGGP